VEIGLDVAETQLRGKQGSLNRCRIETDGSGARWWQVSAF
jgi:hypothetical protein